MAPKSKKVETGTAPSKTAVVSGGAPPNAPIVAGHDDTLSAAANAHSDAIGSSDVPAPSVPSSPPTASGATQAIAPANSDARRLEVANLALQFQTADEALSDGLIGRESLEIEKDDFQREKSGDRPKYWVKKFMEAFSVDYLGDPEDTKKDSPAQKAWYTRWQKDAHVVVVSIFEAKDKSHLEKCCWYLFDAIIKSHELGVLTLAANNWAASKLKCSKRLAATVVIIEKYAPVRLDVLRLWHIEEVAANPEAFVKRKLTNCWNNGIRAEKYAAKKKNGGKGVVQEADDGEKAQAAADVEEDGGDQAVGDAEDGEAQAAADGVDVSEPHVTSPRKTAKEACPSTTQSTTVDGAEKSRNKAKGKKSTNTKRARSAAPEPRETQPNKKPAVSRRRPAGKNASVVVGTKGRSGGRDTSAGAEAEPTV
jgi:hypothetical protein